MCLFKSERAHEFNRDLYLSWSCVCFLFLLQDRHQTGPLRQEEEGWNQRWCGVDRCPFNLCGLLLFTALSFSIILPPSSATSVSSFCAPSSNYRTQFCSLMNEGRGMIPWIDEEVGIHWYTPDVLISFNSNWFTWNCVPQGMRKWWYVGVYFWEMLTVVHTDISDWCYRYWAHIPSGSLLYLAQITDRRTLKEEAAGWDFHASSEEEAWKSHCWSTTA